MGEIAMAMLDVDEIEAAFARTLRRGHEIIDEAAYLVIAHHRPVFGIAELPVEQRVPISDHRLESLMVVRLAEAARMGELQADHEAFVAAHGFAMRIDQGFAQASDRGLRRCRHHELVRIGAPVGAHRDRLAAPDQLAAARAEAPPAPHRVFARAPVALPVPALHRIEREAIADFHAGDFDRRGEERGRPASHDVVARHVEAKRVEMGSKRGDAAEGRELGIFAELHASLISSQS